MVTFLEKVSKEIFDSHKLSDLQHITVVLPSKRAELYFKKSLAKHSDEPFFSPKIWNIDDYIIHRSGFTLMTDLDLYIKLYGIFKENDNSQPFEKFLTWIPTLIGDFENIDFALLENPKELFDYMSERLALTHWGENYQDIISANSKGYFDFFTKAWRLYFKITQYFEESKTCYRAYAYRKVALEIQGKITKDVDFHYFVGFNALNISDEKFITTFIKAKKGKAIWDADTYFMSADHKAGKKLNGYKRSGKFGEWNGEDNFLRTHTKDIQIFKINSSALQAKMAKSLAKSHYGQSHAMVVLDESQFKPLILNIPEENFSFNISIGLPLKNSAFLNFISLVFNHNISFSTKITIVELRAYFQNQSFLQILHTYFTESEIFDLKTDVFSKKHYLINRKTFPLLSAPFFDIIFARQDHKILEKLNSFNQQFENLIHFSAPIEKVGIQFYLEKIEILNKVNSESIDLNPFTIKMIWNELVKNQKVSFENESSSDLQILSMLETRCLDFETVTFLSLNEGILPAKKSLNSFIPNEVKREFKLPNYSDQDAIMSYHFWRLLKRANKINLLYLESASELNNLSEKSSFILQVEEVLAKQNPHLNITYPVSKIKVRPNDKIQKEEIQIEKSNVLLKTIDAFLGNKRLSPTSVAEYNTCTLKFYWKYLENIRTQEIEENDFQKNELGTLMHLVLEKADQDYLKSGKSIGKAELIAMKAKVPVILTQGLKDKFPNKTINKGFNKIHVELSEKMLENYFDSRVEDLDVDYQVVLNETKFNAALPEPYQHIKVTGNIDKIEKHGSEYKIIDFKTGALLDKKNNKERYKEKMIQLEIYQYLLRNSSENTKFKDEVLNFEFIFLINPYESYQLKDTLTINIEYILKTMVEDLLNPEISFSQTSDLQKCNFCEFIEICNRTKTTF